MVIVGLLVVSRYRPCSDAYFMSMACERPQEGVSLVRTHADRGGAKNLDFLVDVIYKWMTAKQDETCL